MSDASAFFDPVLDLPEDVAAVCLSFVDIHSLLGVAQHVSHAWRDAVDGGLPALWRDVRSLSSNALRDEHLTELAQRTHGRIQLFRAECGLSQAGLRCIRSFSRLRVLDIRMQWCDVSLGPELSGVPVLEHFALHGCPVLFPPLQFLQTIRCQWCRKVQGVHNLPSLTKLDVMGGMLEDGGAWPAGLRHVAIRDHKVDPRLFGHIEALQQPIELSTDWSFAAREPTHPHSSFHSQLAFLSGFSSLQRFAIKLDYRYHASLPPQAIFSCMSAMTSLRELELEYVKATDRDLQCLSQLINLQCITLSEMDTITSQGIRYVCESPNLTKLALIDLRRVDDYSHVGMCGQLRELELNEESRSLSLMDARAICQLPSLDKLVLDMNLDDPATISLICSLRGLRDLRMLSWCCVPPSVFANLSALSLLERIRVPRVEDASMLVDCLMRMPRLRHIVVCNWVSTDDRARLREALPRLESLVYAASNGVTVQYP